MSGLLAQHKLYLSFARIQVHSQPGSLRASAGLRRRRKCASQRCRSQLVVLANELNKWADRDGRDDDSTGLDDDGFDRDTKLIMLRVLTARAVTRMILQFEETDVRIAAWFSDFCSQNSPMEGDKFLAKLLAATPTTLHSSVTKEDRHINPSDLADRLIIVRHTMAKSMSALPEYVARSNLDVYRKHLESKIAKDKPKRRGER